VAGRHVMLGLAWSCDWLGCSARMVQAYDDAWGVFPGNCGWVDGSWDMTGEDWTCDEQGKVWCPVHALLHGVESAAALVRGPHEGLLPATTIQDVAALAERYPGELALRVTVPSRYPPGARRLTLGTKVAPDPALVAGLLEYGQVVVIDR
jgi:hypothetical protein